MECYNLPKFSLASTALSKIARTDTSRERRNFHLLVNFHESIVDRYSLQNHSLLVSKNIGNYSLKSYLLLFPNFNLTLSKNH